MEGAWGSTMGCMKVPWLIERLAMADQLLGPQKWNLKHSVSS